ncbi:MAG: DUF2318 domain-containing protein [Candidatus Micrarchaeota archaeon]|nr:DUF2318 domain-containing protein [Candidatus Micrarchaeota archaeon]
MLKIFSGTNLFIFSVLICLIILFFVVNKNQPNFLSNNNSFEQKNSSSFDLNEYLLIDLAEISNKAKFYTYNLNGTNIRFFVLKASDGSIKTAFDACDVCYPYKKGYRQEDNYMVCNACGNKFLIDMLGKENKAGGGCWPVYLPSFVFNNSLLIKKSDLEQGIRLFS